MIPEFYGVNIWLDMGRTNFTDQSSSLEFSFVPESTFEIFLYHAGFNGQIGVLNSRGSITARSTV